MICENWLNQGVGNAFQQSLVVSGPSSHGDVGSDMNGKLPLYVLQQGIGVQNVHLRHGIMTLLQRLIHSLLGSTTVIMIKPNLKKSVIYIAPTNENDDSDLPRRGHRLLPL